MCAGKTRSVNKGHRKKEQTKLYLQRNRLRELLLVLPVFVCVRVGMERKREQVSGEPVEVVKRVLHRNQ